MSFIETIMTPTTDGTITSGVYRKLTHNIYSGIFSTTYLQNTHMLSIHLHTGQGSLLNTRAAMIRNAKPVRSTNPMQVPKVGTQQDKNRTQQKMQPQASPTSQSQQKI